MNRMATCSQRGQPVAWGGGRMGGEWPVAMHPTSYVALDRPRLSAGSGELHHVMRVIVLVHCELPSPPRSRCRNPPTMMPLSGNAP